MSDTSSVVVLITGFLTLVFLLLIAWIIRQVAQRDVDITLRGLGISLDIRRISKPTNPEVEK